MLKVCVHHKSSVYVDVRRWGKPSYYYSNVQQVKFVSSRILHTGPTYTRLWAPVAAAHLLVVSLLNFTTSVDRPRQRRFTWAPPLLLAFHLNHHKHHRLHWEEIKSHPTCNILNSGGSEEGAGLGELPPWSIARPHQTVAWQRPTSAPHRAAPGPPHARQRACSKAIF